jgi:hypothetical protein
MILTFSFFCLTTVVDERVVREWAILLPCVVDRVPGYAS